MTAENINNGNGISYSSYKDIFQREFASLTEEAGMEPGRAIIYTVPATYPFVVGAMQPKRGAHVTKIELSSQKPGQEKGAQTVTLYHVYNDGFTHWEYLKPDSKGKETLFYCSTEFQKQVIDVVKGIDAGNRSEDNFRMRNPKQTLRKEMDVLRKTGEANALLTSAAQRLFAGANRDIKEMRYRASYGNTNGSEPRAEEVRFGIKGNMGKADRELFFVPPRGDKSVDQCGWFIANNGMRTKVGPDVASSFIASL